MVRAGAYALTLLSVPLNVEVLRALKEEPKSLAELRKAAGSPPPTTMRGQLRALTEIGVLERRRRNGFPGNLDFELGPAGRDLLPVLNALQSWLSLAPEGSLDIGSSASKNSIKALVEGWSNGIVRAIAARPLSLTELDGVVRSLSYPSLERRLGAMRDAGQIAPCPTNGRGTPYEATEWLRLALAPLGAAVRWERSHMRDATAAISRLDIEAAFLLIVPKSKLSSEMAGGCRLAVEMLRDGEPTLVGVDVDIRDGEVASCTSRLSGPVDAMATGSISAWLQAVVGREPGRLDLSGDADLSSRLVIGLRGALLGSAQLS